MFPCKTDMITTFTNEVSKTKPFRQHVHTKCSHKMFTQNVHTKCSDKMFRQNVKKQVSVKVKIS